MKLNSQLREVYEEFWPSLIENGSKITNPVPTNPLLLNFDEQYFNQADKKIMICGQETLGWGNFGNSIDGCINGYHSFFIEEEFYSGYGISAYWKAFRFFQSQFNLLFQGQKIQFIYQNLSKIGRNDGVTGVTNEIRTLEREQFPVFKKEMEILKPDMVIFLSGPDRDHDIRFHFPDAVFSQAGDDHNLRRRAWVTSVDLPSASLRLYHPNHYKSWTNQYKDEAVSLLIQKAGEQAASSNH